MKRKISAGLSDFKEVIENNNLYMDKSDFISEVLDAESKVIAIARPRRFGKTLNMSMLSYFFSLNDREENRKLFKGLKIEKSSYFREQGEYPVVSITFKDIKSDTWEESYQDIVSLIKLQYSKHAYLEESDFLNREEKEGYRKILDGGANIAEYKLSLFDLSNYLHKHHGKKVVVLVDEFDTPVIEGELEGYFKKASKFMEGLLGKALKDNPSLHRGVMTGITRLQGVGIFSGLNSGDVCTIFDGEYKDKFGFTENEIKELLEEYGIKDQEQSIKEYYNGYNFDGEVIYNPYSVVKFISKGRFGDFWLGSNSNDLAKKKVMQLLEMKDDEVVRKMVEDLVQGKRVKMEVDEALRISEDMELMDILNLLLLSGYLKYENYRRDKDNVRYAEVSIPNLEIKSIYRKTINAWVKGKYTMEDIEGLKKFLKSVCVGEEEEIKERLERYLNRRSILDGEKVLEMGYHNFLFGLLQGLESRYILESNRESGEGRFDIMLTPVGSEGKGANQERGILIELKATQRDMLKNGSKEAVVQMEDKKYHKKFEDMGIKRARLVGIAFNKKEVEVSLKEITLGNK